MVEHQWLIGRAEGMWGGVLHLLSAAERKLKAFSSLFLLHYPTSRRISGPKSTMQNVETSPPGTMANAMVINSGCQTDTTVVARETVSIADNPRGLGSMQDISTEATKNWLLLFIQTIPSWEEGRGKRKFFFCQVIQKKPFVCFAISKNEAYKENIIRDRKQSELKNVNFIPTTESIN